jgi:mono/diheme cytochrome c family protein
MAYGLSGLSAEEQTPATADPTPEQIAFFETKIRPVLANNCFRCHGKDMQMVGLRLDTLAGLRKGGDSGPVVVAGDPDKSLLVQVIRHTGPIKMPKGKMLKPAEIANVEAWVKMGAPWPKGGATKGQGKGPLWSLQPVKKPAVPEVKKAAWVVNPIDAFVLAKLEAKKLSPAPAVDRRTLLRRVTYDLTGLPPTAAEVDAFLADKSPNAYEKVVDRLLRSPRYGERWARHWLDVARYADTKGYVFEEDRNYHNAYTYREWVIRAFNEDLPYDQFITQQLAADRLPEVQGGDDKRALAAMGFLTIGRRFLNSQPDIIDDRIDVTMRGFQGLTVACARCHDHKFDPIPTQDYYSLYAVFQSSDEATVPISERAVRGPWEKHNERVAATDKAIRELIQTQVKRLRQMVKEPEQEKTLSAEVKQVLQTVREDQVPMGANLTKLASAFGAGQSERLASLQKEAEELKKNAPRSPEFAMAMVDRPNPSDGVVFRRGNPGNHGEAAPRRFLLAMSKAGKEREHWKTGSGRLELAKTIASRENPLTARVFVNRAWQHHFGAGLVRTPSDFGFQGERPTHPELLDYLAASFMENGWSIKKLHRLMVTSATYRQSSAVSPAAYNADPENRTWNRMNRRRLDLEQMRDTLIVAAGRLDLTQVGGKSVDLWKAPFAPRRAVYGFIERQNLPGIFKTFDFASPDSTSARRFLTTVPQQALFFMNSPFSVEQARTVADRAEIVQAKDDAQRVRRLYRLLFGRLPDADETAAGVAYLGLGKVDAPIPSWQYGYGSFDPAKGRVSSFRPLSYAAEAGYRGGKAFPDPELGYLLLNAQGGHPGRDAAHAVVRRWTAPAALTVGIQGQLAHRQPEGDGVRARIVSSRTGLLGEWQAHNGEAKTEVAATSVQRGDTLDFIVDAKGGEAFDGFAWAPTVRTADGKQVWSAATGFGPPVGSAASRLALYAQALMMTNEFLFID